MKRRRRTRGQADDYSDYFDEEPTRPERKKKQRDPGAGVRLPPALIHLAILASIGVLLLGLVWGTGGRPMLEKTLQALVQPLGLIWLGLFLVIYFCLLNRQGFPAFVSFVCWMLLTVCGNSLVSVWILGSLQNQYVEFNIDDMQPLDVVVVLGGGQMTTPSGHAQISDAGDRCLLAVRLFREGKVEKIICTGTSGLPLADGEMTQADALEQILLSLGVDAGKILKIGGRNTKREMQAFDNWITENDGAKLRKGIITSAWHLPRAMRLAEAVGIQAEPIPADFSSTRFKPGPDMLIPSSGNMHQVTRCLKEYLAGIVGR